MPMRVHELHPALVHAPLALLPTAAIVDLAAAVKGGRQRGTIGGSLWWAGAGSGLLAGLAGMAASQEGAVEEPGVRDMMWLHGIVNFGVVLSAIGMASWRSRRPPTVTQAVVGLGACAVSLYTAYLGGEIVYSHGVGVKRDSQPSVRQSPPLLSARAVPTLLRDAVRGLAWLLQRAGRALTREEPIDTRAFGVSETEQAVT
jgi:uncharacterized membrane protein